LRRYLLLAVVLLCSTYGVAQTILDSTLTGIQSQPLPTFLQSFEKQNNVKFFFSPDWLSSYTIDETANGKTLQSALTNALKGTDISFELIFGYAVVFVRDPAGNLLRDELLKAAATSRKAIEEYVIGSKSDFRSGAQVVVTGTVKDETSGAPLVGATILVNDKYAGTSGEAGQYKVSTQAGPQVFSFQYVNYREKVIDLQVYTTGTLHVRMEETPIVMDEVVVSDQAVVNRKVGMTTLKMTDLKRSPTFLGEVDIIKQIQNQPGVTTVGEIASGFNVRGGSVDQNLVLYDGVPIFNTNHALGFFTAFNTDAISQVNFFRGGIPAEYGGRASSVLSITSKEGPYDRWKASGGIGLISSYVAVGGPIKKDTTSVMASVRASYSDWMLNAVKSNYKNISNSAMSFYDASLKFAHKFSKRSKISLSGYSSSDQFQFTNDTIYGMKNFAALAQFDHTFSNKFFGSAALGMGKYAYTVEETDPQNAFELNYEITYPFLKFDFNYDGNNHKLSFGLHNTYYNFQPGKIKPTQETSTILARTMPAEKSLESAAYFSDAFQLNENILIEAGLRLSVFNRIGAGKEYRYLSDSPRETQNIYDSTTFNNGEIMKTYWGLEPRFSLRYSLGMNASIKLGYNRMYQYIHLVTNTAAIAPVDIWQSSNAYFKPQIADQLSLGYFRNFNDDTYEAYGEVFYKEVQNVLDFKDGANLILNKNLEAELLTGKGKSYGFEFSVNKVKGRLVGTLNYTYSRSLRTVNGRFDAEKINDGHEYAANHDQPHVATLNFRYNISRRYFFAGTFTYHTGRPTSLPESAYIVDGVPIPEFSERNKYRIPDYHRLDLAFILEGNHKRKKVFDGTWIVSFYNVYSRKNAYSVFFQDKPNGTLTAYKLSIIGSIIPTVSYSFKF
jgi:TonB-dependent Receptor Plug Domain/CarboxypepD_reg-like domain